MTAHKTVDQTAAESTLNPSSNVITSTKKVKPSGPYGYDNITVKVRWDDSCGNGHNSFAVTGHTTRNGIEDKAGRMHEEIAEHFPELQHLIKWHRCRSDGPLHYISNTVYHASDRDCKGMRKGEKRQLVDGASGLPAWRLKPVDTNGEEIANEDLPLNSINSETCPEGSITYKYVPWCQEGKGKEPGLKAARSSAIWPDASLEQLQDKEALRNRLPALMAEFRADLEALGFIW